MMPNTNASPSCTYRPSGPSLVTYASGAKPFRRRLARHLDELETTPCDAEDLWNEMNLTREEANQEVEYLEEKLGDVRLLLTDTVAPLTKWVLAHHDESHTGVARVCEHEMCRLADQAVDQAGELLL